LVIFIFGNIFSLLFATGGIGAQAKKPPFFFIGPRQSALARRGKRV
jgi:hypothetical protein